MSNTIELYTDLIRCMAESHRMLLRLSKLKPDEFTLIERSMAYDQCKKMQDILDKEFVE